VETSDYSQLSRLSDEVSSCTALIGDEAPSWPIGAILCAQLAKKDAVMKPYGPLRGRDEELATALSVGAYLIATGHTNKSVAKLLGLSINTGDTHLRSIYAKLGVQSRVRLTNVLRERGESQ
jgi:hypothetical protein